MNNSGDASLECQVSFKLDAYILDYQLHCFASLEGEPLTPVRANDLISVLLPFLTDMQRKRVRVKIDKNISDDVVDSD
jgi:hypothetical protein